MNFKGLLFLTLVSVVIWASSCSNDVRTDIPDVSHIEANVDIIRFEEILFSADTTDIVNEIAKIEAEHPEFSDVFFKYIIEIKKPWDTVGLYRRAMTDFVNYPSVQYLYDTTQQVFTDLSEVETSLEEGFKYFQYHFTEMEELPKVYTFISEYGYQVVPPQINNTIGIGLDLFLGSEHKPYYSPQINFPRYVTRTLTKEHIAPQIFRGMLTDLLGDQVSGKRLIDHMIHNGKLWYALDQMLPYAEDSVKFNMTPQQVKWCYDNEFQMWSEIFVNKLYDTNKRDFQKYVEMSPNSPDMPLEAPGNTGSFIGFQIIKRFMENNPETTLSELFTFTDAQKILEQSKYKPRL